MINHPTSIPSYSTTILSPSLVSPQTSFPPAALRFPWTDRDTDTHAHTRLDPAHIHKVPTSTHHSLHTVPDPIRFGLTGTPRYLACLVALLQSSIRQSFEPSFFGSAVSRLLSPTKECGKENLKTVSSHGSRSQHSIWFHSSEANSAPIANPAPLRHA